MAITCMKIGLCLPQFIYSLLYVYCAVLCSYTVNYFALYFYGYINSRKRLIFKIYECVDYIPFSLDFIFISLIIQNKYFPIYYL